MGTKKGIQLAIVLVTLAAAQGAHADVVWGQVNRTIYAALRFQFSRPRKTWPRSRSPARGRGTSG